MKYLLPFFCLVAFNASGQNPNLVPNANFEQYNNCPIGFSQIAQCISWRQYTGGSSDYFNSCATNAVAGVPTNFAGVQAAASGNAYTGVYVYNGSANYKEYIAASITPLQPGLAYEVSMSVSLSDASGWATKDLGAFFYDAGPLSIAPSTSLTVVPQVAFINYGFITDKTNWVRVTGTFLADSAYDNIVIGGFTPVTSLPIQQVPNPGNLSNSGYYYIDSVVVRVLDSLYIGYNGNLLCGTDSFMVQYYAPYSNLYNSGNVFTIQLSNAFGSFATPVNIGSVASITSGSIKVGLPSTLTPGFGYRMRVISSNVADTSNDNGVNIAIGMSTPAKPVAGSNTPVCSGNPLNLVATSSGSSTSWSGPAGFSSSSSTPTIGNAATTASGSYVVNVYNYGCVASDTEVVSVVQSPNAITANSNSPACAGDTVQLTCTISTTGSIYSWSGPNGFSANTRNVSIMSVDALHSGDYIVTATLNGCEKKDTVTVIVYPWPAGKTATSNSPLCETDTIKLTASSTTPGVTYTWTGPVGFSTNVQNPQIYSAQTINSGNYIVTFHSGICQFKDTVPVLVKLLPSPVIAGNNGPVCAGAAGSLSITTGWPGTTFSWTGPAGYSSAVQNPSFATTMASGGDYIVTADYNGCTKKDTTTLVVKPVPVATAAYSGAVCSGLSINFTGTSSLPGSDFNWTGPASFSSTQQNPVLSPATTAHNGSFSLTATLNGCTSAPASVNVTVHGIPAAPTATSNTPVCAGGIMNLFATSITPGVNYNWTGPNGFTSNTQNPSLAPVALNAGGVYSVTADANGCVSPTGSTTVVVNNVSSLGVYPSPNDTLCINNANASFVAVPFNAGAAPQYQWYKNNTLIGSATNISYPATGIADGDTFYCRMTVVGLCADPLILYSNKVGMTVLPMTSGPSVTITADPGTLLSPWQLVQFTAVAVNAGVMPKYQWKRNSQDIIGANSNVWSANNLSNGDTISCVVTSDIWCASPASDVSNRMVVNIKTGIKDIDAGGKMTLYPNPNNGSFIIHLPLALSGGGHWSIDVVNAVGQSVYSNHQSEFIDHKLEVALPASVANGVYLLKLQADGVVYHARFTVSR